MEGPIERGLHPFKVVSQIDLARTVGGGQFLTVQIASYLSKLYLLKAYYACIMA
jgi:hypothetical protein